MLASSVRIRFTFFDQNTQKSIQRLYLVDIEALSTGKVSATCHSIADSSDDAHIVPSARSVAARFLQKALGHNSFQSEVASLSIVGYEIPLLEVQMFVSDAMSFSS